MPPLITLIPNSGIQFWDIDVDAEALPRLTRTFWEQPISHVPDENGQFQVVLHDLIIDDQGNLTDRTGRVPPANETYSINRNQALDMHRGRWLPLPCFLVTAPGQHGEELYDRGPSNWARLHIAAADGDSSAYRLTIAFDTALLPRTTGGAYLGLSHENSERQQEFAFVPSIENNSWFIDEAWVGEWLRQMLLEHRTELRKGRPLRKDDMPPPCEHYARYLVLLELLESLEQFPRVKVMDTVSAQLGYAPVEVDLVLDIGNTRTCGILIEEHPGQGLNLTDSYELALRELSRPQVIHSDPFESRVEFARANFGPEAVSRRSGRPSAFAWPSPVRVGPEAVRLAGARIGTEGTSGLSSPKRYLWDNRPSTQGWRFNGKASDGITTDPPITGPFMALVGENGSVLGQQRGATTPAARARFSRQSIFTFMLTEILLQALNQMNAPGNRSRRRDADKPRRLRSVLLTMPPGMPIAEQRILRACSNDAVHLAWSMLGMSSKLHPTVKAELDEASATQIVWLHNEITERLQGDAKSLMEIVGRVRPETGEAPSLRLASIDIGGGTTDLMVTTYTLSGEAVVPRQLFRESFKIAGDDVLERIITRVVMPSFASALAAAGVNEPQALLTRTLGQDQGGQDEQMRHLRRLFVSMVLEPVGLAILKAYEDIENRTTGEVLRDNVGHLIGDLAGAARALSYLDDAARDAGARDFHVANVEIVGDTRRIEPVVSGVLGPVLADLCEVVWTYDCDALLLSGRPSRMRVVTDIVLAKAPVPPHRVIGMHRYRVGERYPFRDAANRIKDPKTTAVVGAALCVQAEGRLRNFTMRTRTLTMRSTARIIGKMYNDGQISNANVLLDDVDLDAPPTEDSGFTLEFQNLTQIGFRQLPIERWTATPLYIMEFENPDNAKSFDLPLRVKVRREQPKQDKLRAVPAGRDEPEDPGHEMRETFVVDEVMDAASAQQRREVVKLRLQTMDDQDGYWRDTGRLSLG